MILAKRLISSLKTRTSAEQRLPRLKHWEGEESVYGKKRTGERYFLEVF
jgi:hypothetical protein